MTKSSHGLEDKKEYDKEEKVDREKDILGFLRQQYSYLFNLSEEKFHEEFKDYPIYKFINLCFSTGTAQPMIEEWDATYATLTGYTGIFLRLVQLYCEKNQVHNIHPNIVCRVINSVPDFYPKSLGTYTSATLKERLFQDYIELERYYEKQNIHKTAFNMDSIDNVFLFGLQGRDFSLSSRYARYDEDDKRASANRVLLMLKRWSEVHLLNSWYFELLVKIQKLDMNSHSLRANVILVFEGYIDKLLTYLIKYDSAARSFIENILEKFEVIEADSFPFPEVITQIIWEYASFNAMAIAKKVYCNLMLEKVGDSTFLEWIFTHHYKSPIIITEDHPFCKMVKILLINHAAEIYKILLTTSNTSLQNSLNQMVLRFNKDDHLTSEIAPSRDLTTAINEICVSPRFILSFNNDYTKYLSHANILLSSIPDRKNGDRFDEVHMKLACNFIQSEGTVLANFFEGFLKSLNDADFIAFVMTLNVKKIIPSALLIILEAIKQVPSVKQALFYNKIFVDTRLLQEKLAPLQLKPKEIIHLFSFNSFRVEKTAKPLIQQLDGYILNSSNKFTLKTIDPLRLIQAAKAKWIIASSGIEPKKLVPLIKEIQQGHDLRREYYLGTSSRLAKMLVDPIIKNNSIRFHGFFQTSNDKAWRVVRSLEAKPSAPLRF